MQSHAAPQRQLGAQAYRSPHVQRSAFTFAQAQVDSSHAHVF